MIKEGETMFQIENRIFDSKVVVAPMAGITNRAFRKILKEFSPAIIYTEMVSDLAITYRNKRTLDMMKIDTDEGSVALQLFGNTPAALREATSYSCEHTRADFIDLNLGCPVPKVTKNGSGASLMLDPDKVYDLVRNMVEAASVPVTVKIRTGWDRENITAVEVAKKAQEAGAKLIAIHGRTRAQMYGGYVDYETIKAVKDAVDIPVIGNGDITTPEEAKMMLERAGVDAVMVGRGLKGNPWLISQINDYLRTGTYEKHIPIDAIFSMIKRHTELLIEQKGADVALLEMRSHAAWYLKGLPQSTRIKRAIASITDKENLFRLLEDYGNYLRKLGITNKET